MPPPTLGQALLTRLGPTRAPCWASRNRFLEIAAGPAWLQDSNLPYPQRRRGTRECGSPIWGPHGAAALLSPWRSESSQGVGLHDPLNQRMGTTSGRQGADRHALDPVEHPGASLRQLTWWACKSTWLDFGCHPSASSPPAGGTMRIWAAVVFCAFNPRSRNASAQVCVPHCRQRPATRFTPLSSILWCGRLQRTVQGVVQRSR